MSADRRRSAVADRLRELRRVRGLTQAQLAEGVGITQKMVSHYEVARYIPTAEMLDRLADALEVKAEQRGELHDQVAELSVEVSALRVIHRRGGERSIQADIGAQERAAQTIWDYQGVIIPGLLQTADYSRAMVPLIAPTLPDLDDLIAGRAERQRVLYDSSKSFRFLLHESALRARVAPDQVLRGQLDRLLYLASALPHLAIRVLPFSARLRDTWVMTSFIALDDRVWVELQAGLVAIRDPREVVMYRE
ncbi:MAG: helix-turn-helix domain-containing protein, partial [Thermoplasmata archaeon]